MPKERISFVRAVPAPALRVSFNKAARCQDVAELAHLLAQRRGFALLHDPESWLAALQAVNARPFGARTGSPGRQPPRL